MAWLPQQQLTAAMFNNWTAWTPSWVANGSAITLNGNSFARYIILGKTVYAQFGLMAASTATAGTNWQLNPPVLPLLHTSVLTMVGSGQATVNNASWLDGNFLASGTILNMFRPSVAGYLNGLVAVGDQWVGNLMYEAA